jgi:hypothetical protein
MRNTIQNEAAKLLRLGLQFFAEGDGGAGSGAAASGAGGQPAAGGQPSDAPTASGNNTGSGSGTGQPAGKTYTDEDAAAVAKQFGLMTYDAAKKRFKGPLDKAHKHDDMSLRLGALATRYGLEAGATPDDVLAAIEKDRGYIEKKAMELGTDNETAERYVIMEEKLARIEREKLAESDRQAMKKLSEQEQAVKAVYPDFDPEKAADNRVFKTLEDSGVPMMDAYRAAYSVDLTAKAVEAAKADARNEAMEEYKRNGGRPREGASSGSGTNVANVGRPMTKEEASNIIKKYTS